VRLRERGHCCAARGMYSITRIKLLMKIEA
jgi:hypothetical protein